jgi:hypothetical protein
MRGRAGGRGARTATRTNRTYALRHRVRCGCGATTYFPTLTLGSPNSSATSTSTITFAATAAGCRHRADHRYVSDQGRHPREYVRKLERYRQAREAGTESTIGAAWIRQVTTERASTEAQFAASTAQGDGDRELVQPSSRTLQAIGGLLPFPQESDPALGPW